MMADSVAITAPPPPVVRRVALPDLNELGPWLVKRLTERYTEATPPEILGWLRGCLASNDMLFIRTDHCCALTQLVRAPLERQPVAYEVFVFAQPGYAEEAEAFYPRMASWAAHHDASRLEVDRHTDVERNMIRGVVGRLISVTRPHLVLGRLS